MQINFDRFELGIDLRKDAAVSDANRLREMKNAYVTTGLTAAKRPGFSKVCTLEPGTSGLCAALGKLTEGICKRKLALTDIKRLCRPVIHLCIDIYCILSVPRSRECCVPLTCKVNRLAYRNINLILRGSLSSVS